MIETLTNGNTSDFRKWLKGLTKAEILRFACHCAIYDLLDIFDIEKHFNS